MSGAKGGDGHRAGTQVPGEPSALMRRLAKNSGLRCTGLDSTRSRVHVREKKGGIPVPGLVKSD